MSAAHPDSVPQENIPEGERRVAFFEELHKHVGCPFPEYADAWPCLDANGKPCKHKDFWPCRLRRAAPRKLTTPTMVRLSGRLRFRFRDLEQASSLVLHMSLMDRMMVDTGQGTNALAAASYLTRSSTLAMGLSAHGQTLVWVVETISAAAAELLKAYIASTWIRPDMSEISTGAWDRVDADA